MGFHKASNRYENGVAYVVADASWLSLHLRRSTLWLGTTSCPWRGNRTAIMIVSSLIASFGRTYR